MRLFLAIPMDGAVKAQLTDVLDRLQQSEWPVRWGRADQLHLTMKFLGEVEPARLDDIKRGAGRAGEGTPPLNLALTEMGAFPTMSRARVLWAGLDGGPALELLADRVEREFEALGFQVEGRPFRPHVTLGRVRDQRRLPSEAASTLQAVSFDGAFLADCLILYQSRQGSAGMVHDPLLTIRCRS